jgi:hypothetical protein
MKNVASIFEAVSVLLYHKNGIKVVHVIAKLFIFLADSSKRAKALATSTFLGLSFRLKRAVARDFYTRVFLMDLLYKGPRFRLLFRLREVIEIF